MSAPLRRRVAALEREHLAHDHRVHEDDRSAAPLLEARDRGLREVEASPEVHIHRGLPALEVDILEQLERGRVEAVLHDGVDAAERVDGRGDDAVAVRAVGDVGGNGDDAAPVGVDLLAHLLEVRFGPRADGDGRALAGELHCELAAQPGPDAGDDGDLVLE
jgi:hypothetical protein